MIDYYIFGFGLVVTVIVGFGLATMIITHNRMIETVKRESALQSEGEPVQVAGSAKAD